MRRALALLVFLVTACRSAAPPQAFPELPPSTAEQTRARLESIRASFRGARALMRMRITTAGKTRSFRAQLAVDDGDRMLLTLYTPIGTTAAVLFAEGDRIKLRDHLENTTWEGKTGELAPSFGFLRAPISPASLSILLLGLPTAGDVAYEYGDRGLSRAIAGDVVVTFNPPRFPPEHAEIVRGADRLEADFHEVSASSEPVRGIR